MMDKAKKNILIKNRVGLVENINIEDGLLTQIASQQILTQRTIKSIEVKEDFMGKFKANTKLLYLFTETRTVENCENTSLFLFFTGQKDII